MNCIQDRRFFHKMPVSWGRDSDGTAFFVYVFWIWDKNLKKAVTFFVLLYLMCERNRERKEGRCTWREWRMWQSGNGMQLFVI